MLNTNVGVRIRELRENRKLSRETLAEKIDISTKFLYEIETGKKGFSAEILCRLSKELAVSCDYIMWGDGPWNGDMEKNICLPQGIEPEQARQMQDILKILYDMCEINTAETEEKDFLEH